MQDFHLYGVFDTMLLVLLLQERICVLSPTTDGKQSKKHFLCFSQRCPHESELYTALLSPPCAGKWEEGAAAQSPAFSRRARSAMGGERSVLQLDGGAHWCRAGHDEMLVTAGSE